MARRKTKEEFSLELKELYGDEYTLVSDYINVKNKVVVMHTPCKKEFIRRPTTLLMGNLKCDECYAHPQSKSHSTFLREVFETVGEEYSVIGEYVKNNEYVLIKHNKCNHEWSIYPSSFLSGNRCPKCSSKAAWTHGHFLEEVKKIHGNEYLILGMYSTQREKILVKHIECGREYKAHPQTILKGGTCDRCADKTRSEKRRKSHSEYEKEFYSSDTEGEYILLSEYEGVNSKIEVEHVTCGNIYSVPPRDFIAGRRCPKCYGTFKKTNEDFIGEVFELVGNEYEVLSEYINTVSPITLKHNICGRVYETKPSYFLSGSRCYECAIKLRGERRNKTHAQFVEEVFSLVGDEYEVIGSYTKAVDKIILKHNVCGTEYDVTPNGFLGGRRCRKCFAAREIDTKVFKEDIYELVGNEYQVLGEYSNNYTPILMKHMECENSFSVIPSSFKTGRRCSYCFQSIGERIVYDVLKEIELSFVKEQKFAECRNVSLLRFDYYIEGKILLEYDGRHHFEIVNFSEDVEVAKADFERMQENDRIKNQFCIDSDILLIRIPYWDINRIKEILIAILLQHGLLNKPQTKVNYKSNIKKYIVDADWNHEYYLASNPKNKEAI